ncbi:unnamed protein product [Paramecium primaurelia]|uniref:Uncharacterized protein n=1 Tax=Paramecium primaurelia TaxID=5886 RepID=A0A8S1NLF7_PARPR|nr:unnamed protein product [Paramecium primaurelia]
MQVLGQETEYCKLQNQDNNLITIAKNENYDFYLYDYVIADDLTYNFKTDSSSLFSPPFQFMMKKKKSGILSDDVIEIITIYENNYNKQYYYCFSRSIQNDQIVYRLYKCKLDSKKEDLNIEVEFFIIRNHCHQIGYSNGYYLITCQNIETNQLELIFFHPNTKLYQTILIKDVIVPPQSKVKLKISNLYFGILISKGRIENNEYISEDSQLYFFFVNFLMLIKQESYEKLVLYKQYQVLNEPDDYVTDFAIQFEIAFITRLKRGLTFRNLKITWSDEIKILQFRQETYGIHLPKLQTDVSATYYYIMLMVWGKESILFISFKINKDYSLQKQGDFQCTALFAYQLKPEQPFQRKVVSSNLYIVFSNDEEFSIFSIDFSKSVLIILIYQDYVKSKFFVFNLAQQTLLYEQQGVVYTLDLELPKIEIINLTEIKGPQLLQITATTFDKYSDKFSCPNIKIYYQVQELNVNSIWLQQYIQQNQNVFNLKYSKIEQKKQIDLSKVFLGQALKIEEININKQSMFEASFTNIISQLDQIYIKNQKLKSVDYATTCLYSYPYNDKKIFLFKKVSIYLFIIQCYYQTNQACHLLNILAIQDNIIQDFACESFGNALQIVIIQKMKHGLVGYVASVYLLMQYDNQILINESYDRFQDSEGNILSIAIYPKILIYTRVVNDIYTLNLLQHEKRQNELSQELNCYKVFEIVCDFENFQNLLFIPMIKYKNYKYYLIIEIYMIQNLSKFQYLGSVNLGQTKKPTKERLQIELVKDGIIILQLTDISQDEQIKKLMYIDYLVFFRIFFDKQIDGEISIKQLRHKTFPTFNLKNINKIKTSEKFLYVYGSEIDVPACIYVYRLYSNQMDSLYYIIRTDLESFQVYNVVSTKESDLILIQLNEFMGIYLNHKKIITITKKQLLNKNDDYDYADELIKLKIKPLGSKDENNIQDFYIKLICGDCEGVNGSS